jgi:glycerol-3-phosphate dehydrogenase
MLRDCGVELEEKKDFNPIRQAMHKFKEASIEEKNEIIKSDSSYGRIICRCESVSEGEILAAIRTNPKPTNIDGIKRRTRASMGRCQGGFCTPYMVELLAREMGVPVTEITKSGAGSYINVGKTDKGAK